MVNTKKFYKKAFLITIMICVIMYIIIAFVGASIINVIDYDGKNVIQGNKESITDIFINNMKLVIWNFIGILSFGLQL